MAPGVAARMASVCVLLLGVVIARAQPPRRPVAVIELSGEPAGAQLSKRLGQALLDHDELKPVADLALVAALSGPFVDEDERGYNIARGDLKSAEDRLAQFQFASAASTARDAQDGLLRIHPSKQTVELYAQLAFVLGQARLGERKPVEAAEAFLLVHQLQPELAPDPARYLPDVVRAFDTAKASVKDTGTLVIRGSGRAWVDGREVGIASAGTSPSVELTVGTHVVWLTGPTRLPEGKVVKLRAGGETAININDAPADEGLKVRRARAMLHNAPDPAARAAAIKQLAQMLDVRDAVLLTMANGKLIFQTWRDQAPGFSALREVKDAKPLDLLDQLAPRKPASPKVEDPPPIIPVEEPRWYQRRSVRIGIGATVLAAVVGSFLLVRSIDEHVPLDTDPGFSTK